MSAADVISDGVDLVTNGLHRVQHPEIRLTFGDASVSEEAAAYLLHVVEYIESGAVLRSNQTLSYGYWLTKFISGDDGFLNVFEYNAECTDFVLGLRLTLNYWRDQHEICARFGAAFQPPRPDSLVAVSDGVFDGEDVQAVRYPSPSHMSGWWMTTHKYDGNVSSLKREHAYHVTARRPDLAPYIALPFGFRLDFTSGCDVWLDAEVASESAS